MLLFHLRIYQFVSSDPTFSCHLAPKDQKLGKPPQMWISPVWADVVSEHRKWRRCQGCSSAALWLLTDLCFRVTINQCTVNKSPAAAFKSFKITWRYPQSKGAVINLCLVHHRGQEFSFSPQNVDLEIFWRNINTLLPKVELLVKRSAISLQFMKSFESRFTVYWLYLFV